LLQGVQACLAQLDPEVLGPGQASVASAGLSCLAAAFAAKPPCALLAERLLGSEARRLPALLLAFAAGGGASRPIQLEAALALRGLAQQYHGALLGCWDAVLRLAQGAAGAGGAPRGAGSPTQSPRAQSGGPLLHTPLNSNSTSSLMCWEIEHHGGHSTQTIMCGG